ncbi:MAG: FMN-binding negative transcriptional regulator [Flavobacterium sp.]|uniref:FMN-binding negative transcriptional regulator n=1 Tax=Flavobacterium sp. TaxID=239 RepID=UPI003263F39B
MYIPDIYKNKNQEEIINFLQKNSFGILINQNEGNILATHIPLELEVTENGKQFLEGHISKENPQWKTFESDNQILAIFSGPHSYISPSWYDHENVPTWNYIAVHVYGKVKVLNYQETILSLKKLVDKYETNSKNPVRIEDLSGKTMRQAQGIVAFQIEITSIEAVKKISQNRDKKNHQNIISELEKTEDYNACQIAQEMAKNKK